MDNEHIRYDQDTYLAERMMLIELEKEASKKFDKAILTLSAGAFGLSITFIRQIAPNPLVESLAFLKYSWYSFCFSIVFTLLSFLLYQRAIKRQREILDMDQEGKLEARAQKNVVAFIANTFSLFAAFLFIIGIFLLAKFSMLNIIK